MNDPREPAELLTKIAVAVLFSALFFHLTAPVIDPDLWWHLASGRWMVEHKALMQQDPFSLDFHFVEPPLFRDFILKQYWLSQVIMYLLYALSGFTGIVLLCAAVYTAMFYLLYRLLCVSGAGRFLSAGVTYLAAEIVIREFHYVVVRPQMWSGMFCVLVLLILEMLKEQRRWTFIALPLLMLLWSNMHGGFVLGDFIIVIYMVGGLLRREKKRSFYAVTGLALLLSGANPAGFNALLVTMPLAGPVMESLHLSTQQHVTGQVDTIIEMQSIFKHASLAGIVRQLPLYSLLLAGSLLSFALNARGLRAMSREHIILYLLMLVIGVRTIRFIIFFVAAASFITGLNLKAFLDRHSPVAPVWVSFVSRPAFFIIVVLAIAAGQVSAGMKTTALTTGQHYSGPYDRAIDFLDQNHVHGNVFNEYSAGGRIIWQLYPAVRVSIDGRLLYENVFQLYKIVVDHPVEYRTAAGIPVYKALLAEHDIDLVLMPGCDAASGTLIKLVLALIWDPEWVLVYADGNSLIFMRDSPRNRGFTDRFRLDKTVAYQQIQGLAVAAGRSEHARLIPNWKLSLAVAYHGLGAIPEARQWLDEYLSAVPQDRFAQELKERMPAP